MRLSRQQKVYLAILALALGALVVDRLLRSRPAIRRVAAETSAYSDLLPGETAAGKTDLPDPNSQVPRIKLAQRLEILWPDDCLSSAFEGARDAFCLPAAWLNKLSAQNPLVEADATARFANSHQLNAVLIDGKTRSVLVDGHLLIPGQELDGFKLISVDEFSATFAPAAISGLVSAKAEAVAGQENAGGTKQIVLNLKTDR